MQSGSKLVLLLAGLALVLGAVSWWNRYDLAHRATEFWGPENARIIVEPGEVEALLLTEASDRDETSPDSQVSGYTVQSRADLTKALGLAHLRYALTTDSNYDWEARPSEPIAWKWVFRFVGEEGELLIFFTEDFSILGKLASGSTSIEARSIAPMAETLRNYFLAGKTTLPKAPAEGASNLGE